ncbi:hypothetical protein [Terriglobus aquaticus]|uniref:PEP-CTERM protein-sorting domain-containing protein n=1 Tax=Terriglobus aquaticus TaxID=940139 RepID=A0ABW9KJH4_9BACT|nr:hypothetical protein [Terriglobus aquaticus]
MKLRFMVAGALLVAGMSASSAFADPLTFFTDSVSTSDATQQGRLVRSGQAQTWAGAEGSFPGTNNTGVTFYYKTYTFSNSLFNPNNYIDISVFDESNSGLFFVSAYAGSYNPAAKGQNWLGDEGASGNIQFFSNDPGEARDFEVIVPNGQDLVLVVNTTGGGTSGTGYKYDIAVNDYSDSEYDNVPVTPYVAATPEPSTFVELGTAVVAFAGMARRRFLKA